MPVPRIFMGFTVEVVPGFEEAEALDIVETLLEESIGVDDWEINAVTENEFEAYPTGGDVHVADAVDSYRSILEEDPAVHEVVPHYRRYTSVATPPSNIPATLDPLWALRRMNVRDAWNLMPTAPGRKQGEGVVIGHTDTGYTRHPEILTRLDLGNARDFKTPNANPPALDPLLKGGKFDDRHPGHGTSTASVIVSPDRSQTLHAKRGVSGVSPKATLVPIRTDLGVIYRKQSALERLADGIEYATSIGCDVISMSLGGIPDGTVSMLSGFPDHAHTRKLRAAVEAAAAQGVIMVAAAGNQKWTIAYRDPLVPAAYPEVVGMAASTVRDRAWSGTYTGDHLAAAAPGELVWRAKTKRKEGRLRYSVAQGNGTSYATAHVAGVAALWLAFHGGRQALSARLGGVAEIPRVFKQALRDTAKTPSRWKEDLHGAGIVDAAALLRAPL